ncbi:TetR/AcrR family transcriptional regulator [Actinomadura madurae]|uniref:TetR family transcriptional regulator n=1 Tax=Actinomadura madurae TaxID=1993 RepID=UPI0020D21955|nr:TetR family transcriptional regulator [Actinomadura madurae]MCP9970714.1 TetR/AcrR family transcriptional regulator [Actinomadura madurae]
MGRWEPNARGRLEEAALDLYGERGFEKTTVAEIARAAPGSPSARSSGTSPTSARSCSGARRCWRT